MDMDEQEELGMERSAQLQQARQASEQYRAQTKEPAQAQDEPSPPHISTLEFGLMIGFLGIFFDLPQAFLAATFVGIIVSWILGFVGYLTIYVWLKIRGRSLIGVKQASKRLFTFFGSAVVDTASGGFLPGLSGCVFGMMVIDRAEELAAKRGGKAGALLKKVI